MAVKGKAFTRSPCSAVKSLLKIMDPMDKADATITAIRDVALLKIGRNVVLFQQLENVLQFLASAQNPSIPISQATATQAKRAQSIRFTTLGQVAGQVEDLFSASDEESSAPAEGTETLLGISFRIEGDPREIEDNRKTLRALIKERNDLVHHLLSRWNPHDVESCRALSLELDEQRVRIIREIERYRAYATTVGEMAKELQAFIDSDDGKRYCDFMFLQNSRLATLLAQIATTHAREDGWTLLSVAGEQLSNLIPEQFAKLKREHGAGSLHQLVETIDLFDVQSEPMPKGGSRTIYRNRT